METWYNHKIYHGFRLLSQEQLPELNATGYLFLHEKIKGRSAGGKPVLHPLALLTFK